MDKQGQSPDNKGAQIPAKNGINLKASDNSGLSQIQFAFLKKYLDKNF